MSTGGLRPAKLPSQRRPANNDSKYAPIYHTNKTAGHVAPKTKQSRHTDELAGRDFRNTA